MRVMVDANLLISYLLVRSRGNPTTIVEAAVAAAFTLLLPDQLVAEVTRRVATKPYLAQRIAPDDLTELFALLSRGAEIIPEVLDEVPEVARDQKDDYILAHAVRAHADYLVSGDKDLQVLVEVKGLKIISPADFVGLLKAQGLI